MQTVVTDKKTALETISILNFMLIFNFATNQLFSVIQRQILLLCSLWVLNICFKSVIYPANFILIPDNIYIKFPGKAKHIHPNFITDFLKNCQACVKIKGPYVTVQEYMKSIRQGIWICLNFFHRTLQVPIASMEKVNNDFAKCRPLPSMMMV